MRLRYWIKKKLGIVKPYPSATSKVRHLVIEYCKGKGCDVGFGGDKIKKDQCDGIDYEHPYAYTGKEQVDIPCIVGKEPIPVADNSYDYVYSSHLIEDFENTTAVLADFVRILKPGGNLVLVFPDQPLYEEYCIKYNLPINLSHVHKNMGMSYMMEQLNLLKNISCQVLFTSDCEIEYNVIIVARVQK
jgi:SAM-dependent methyltransferase